MSRRSAPLPNTTKPANSSAQAQIRAVGVKVTPGRVRVFELLRAASKPLSHAEIEAQLVEAGEAAIDRVTVYRVLDSLVAGGLALKAVDTRGVFRYSCPGALQQHRGHVHFRCVACGGMFCLDIAQPRAPRLPRGFELHEVEFDVRGRCRNCSEGTSC